MSSKTNTTAREILPLHGLALLVGLFGAIVAIAVVAGSAQAWQQKSMEPIIGNYQTGEAHLDCGSAGPVQAQWHQYVALYRNGCALFDDYFAYDVSNFDHDSYIAGAHLAVTFWATGGACSNLGWAIRPLYVDPLPYIPNQFGSFVPYIENGPNWDAFTNSPNQFREFDAGQQFIGYVRQAMADGNDTLRFAIVQTSTCPDVSLYIGTNLTLTLQFDNTPPTPPSIQPLPAWSNVNVHVQWGASNDSGIGVAGYLAAWSRDATFESLGGTSGWVDNATFDYLHMWLPTGPVLYFAVRSRDGAGFESNWSAPTSTSVDPDAPSVPSNLRVPAIQSTALFNVYWDPSQDAASGVRGYNLVFGLSGSGSIQSRSIDGKFNTSYGIVVPATEYDQLYFVAVQSVDNSGLSSLPATAFFMVDSLPPSNVSLVLEPTVSPGQTNSIEWGPSTDAGVGGVSYLVQASVDLSFVPLFGAITTSNLSANFSGLSDGAKYYYRVQALDALGHPTPWAITYSTQDNVPPPAPVLEPVPPWINTPAISFSWSVAPNSEPIANGSWKAVRGGGLRFTESQGVTTGSDRITLNISHAETTHFCVEFQDVAGLTSNESCADTTADFEPPHTAISPTNLTSVLYTPGRMHFEGTSRDDLSGVAFVEYSDTTNHTQWGLVNGESAWSYSIVYGPGDCHYLFRETTIILFVRSTDLAGNVEENPPWTAIQLVVCPVPLRITSPANGSRLSGTTLVVASAPSSQGNATLQYQRAGGDWVDVDMVSEPTKPGSTNLGLMWDTTLVEDGPYWLRVILKSGSATVPLSVTVANARIGLLAGDLLVDPASPKAGGTITLRVHPENLGSGIAPPTWMNWTVVTPGGSRTYSRLLTSDELRGSSRFATDLVALDLNGASHFHIDVTFESDDPHYHALFTTGEVFIEPAAAGNNGGAISTGSSADASALLLGAIGAVLGAAGILLSFMRNRRPASSAGTPRVSNAGRTSGGSEAEPDDDMHGDSPSRLWRRDR